MRGRRQRLNDSYRVRVRRTGRGPVGAFRGAKASGGPGADVIYGHNDERNAVSCGTGSDTVYLDGKLDSLATDCEKQISRQFEPPLNVPFDD